MAENRKPETDQTEGIRRAAQSATEAVKRETTALAVGAADHPHTATTLVVTIAGLAFAAGYLLGRSAGASQNYYWR